ncbi:MAG: Proteasome subunit beta type-7, partial [Marteilia pararefringens]
MIEKTLYIIEFHMFFCLYTYYFLSICGSGVSADLIHLTHKVSRQAEHQKALFGKILVENVVKPLSNTLFNYMGALNVGLLVGGFDRCGAQLYTVSGNGYNTRLPFAAEGSGSTFALPFLHKNYEYDLP